MIKLFSILILVVGLYLCTNKSEKENEIDKETIRKEIRTMFQKYNQSVSEKGLIGEFDYLDNSEDFFWVPPGFQSTLSYDSVRSILNQNSAKFTSVHIEWQELLINPLSPTIANYTGLVKSSMTDTDGLETISFILESGTVIKRDSSWKILSGQSRIKE